MPSGVGSGQKRLLQALEGQTVLVTGPARGLGAAIARHLHGLGARLILLDRDEKGLAETGAACPGATSVVVDLADAGATKRAIAEVVTGPVDTLIHNAAILRVEPLGAVSLGTFQETLNVGIQAAFQLTKAVWSGMKGTGWYAGLRLLAIRRRRIRRRDRLLRREARAGRLLEVPGSRGRVPRDPVRDHHAGDLHAHAHV